MKLKFCIDAVGFFQRITQLIRDPNDVTSCSFIIQRSFVTKSFFSSSYFRNLFYLKFILVLIWSWVILDSKWLFFLFSIQYLGFSFVDSFKQKKVFLGFITCITIFSLLIISSCLLVQTRIIKQIKDSIQVLKVTDGCK